MGFGAITIGNFAISLFLACLRKKAEHGEEDQGHKLGESCAGLGKTRAKTPKVIRRARVRTRLRVVSAPTSRGAGADGEPAELVAVHVV